MLMQNGSVYSSAKKGETMTIGLMYIQDNTKIIRKIDHIDS